MRGFSQIDVFTGTAMLGNPVAVVHEAAGLGDAQLAAFARWTNLSETTFLLPPEDERVDYRVRIFTPGGELPFAGHPTLGTARAWLEAGGIPRDESRIIQECGVGLVTVRREGDRLAFAAPELLRSGPFDEAKRVRLLLDLGLQPDQVLGIEWVDNGPGWLGLHVDSAQTVLDFQLPPTAHELPPLGLIGPHADPDAIGADVEVRAFVPGLGVAEDPVTGSLNAGLAQWLIGTGAMPPRYTARQGTALQRRGLVHISAEDDHVWVGGDTVPMIRGQVDFPAGGVA